MEMMGTFNPFGSSGGGAPGHDGADGVGISSITFVSSSAGGAAGQPNATDTYKIEYTDGNSTTFKVTNGTTGAKGDKGEQGEKGIDGRGIVSITFKSSSLGEEAGIVGATDTYEILFSDNTITNFIVKNGTALPLDTEMSDNSSNGVENKVIKKYVDETVNKVSDLAINDVKLTKITKSANDLLIPGKIVKTTDETTGKVSTGELFNGAVVATGDNSHAEGQYTQAMGDNSHAEGLATQAIGKNSHAEGTGAAAKGQGSHAEGEGTTASGVHSHAEGFTSQAIGNNSHAEGNSTKANGQESHAGGRNSIATADGSFVHGQGLKVTRPDAAAFGTFNEDSEDNVFCIGGGTSDTDRNNLLAVDSNGNVVIKGKIAASQISYNNTTSHLEANNAQAAIDELVAITYPSINITADSGAVITATNGAIILTATMEQTPLKMLIPSYGKWTFSASLNGKIISKIINFTTSKIYNVELTFDNVYGVEWGLTGQTLSRTGAAAQFTNPVPYVNNGMSAEDCGSPFDNLYPWNGMIRETVDGNEVVKIPKFWYKIEKTNSKLSIQIADAPRTGFNVSPAHRARGSYPEQDYVYIGRYHSDSNYKSTSGVIPITNITRATARTNQAAIGNGYHQLDFSLWVTIWMLYLVEFANWNTQSMIGYNCGNNSSKENTGSTDTMPYHTGTMQASKTTYGVGVQYRYIEDPWGNVLDWCDGITFGPDENNNAGEGIYCFKNFADYSDDYNSANAVLVGRRANVPNFIQDFDQSSVDGFDWVLYPGNDDTANSQNQISDYCDFNTVGVVLFVGGNNNQSSTRGLFCLYGHSAASGEYGGIGIRLQKIPTIN